MSISRKTIKHLEKGVRKQFKPERILCVQDSCSRKYYCSGKEYNSLDEVRTDYNLSPEDEISAIEVDPTGIEKYHLSGKICL